MELIVIVALALFLLQVVAWLILPGDGQLTESSIDLSSIGDEAKSKVAAATK